MAITLDDPAKQGSSYFPIIAFQDEHGNAVTPNSISWTLRNEDGEIVNSRENVEVVTPAAEITIILSGDDLLLANGSRRTLVVSARYDSDLAPDLPLTEYATFDIE